MSLKQKFLKCKNLLTLPLYLCVIAITCRLGFWQLQRAQQKQTLQAQMNTIKQAAPIRLNRFPLTAMLAVYHPVSVYGVFDPRYTVYLENRPYQNQVGFYVLMALRVVAPDQDLAAAARYLMINRGWLPRDFTERTKIPAYTTPKQAIWIEGIVKQQIGQLFTLGKATINSTNPLIMQNFDLKKYQEVTGLALYPFLIEQNNQLSDQLIRDWPKPNFNIDRHYGYAFQWLGLALVLVVMGIFYRWKSQNFDRPYYDQGIVKPK